MANALLITLLGMGMVFLSILLLWGLMALLVRLTREPEPVEVQEIEETAAVEPPPDQVLLIERKRRAAAAAVAVALSSRDTHPTLTLSPGAKTPPVSVSAWQAVHRAGQLSQRGISARKKVAR
jgi:Na+-transporting methylmalonyl-CoA/oxaloacetate decarboxylase gamma subunit